MKIPGLEAPATPAHHPRPWRVDEDSCCVVDADGAIVDDWIWSVTALFLSSGPEMAEALVEVTQDLADCLEDLAPSRGSTWTDPLQHPAVQKALAALAKARGEA